MFFLSSNQITNKSEVSNHRSISFLCATAKLFELALQKVFSFHLNHIIIPNRHHFISGLNNNTNLVTFMTHTSTVVISEGPGWRCSPRFEQSFPRCYAPISSRKVSALWHRSFICSPSTQLSPWSLLLYQHELTSFWCTATSGVPQCSVLCQLLLFLLMTFPLWSRILRSSFMQMV